MNVGYALFGGLSVVALHAAAQEGKADRYREMLLKKPENAVVFGRLVDAWLETGEMAGLKDFLEEKAKAATGEAADWRLLAVFRGHAGDEAGAIAALDEALKLAPDDAAVRLARGKVLGVGQRFDAALADLAIAAKDPALALEAGTLRGKFLARSGNAAGAVAAWKEVIAANPADQGLVEDLIELEIGEGMIDEAVATARDLTAKTPDPYQKALRRMHVAEILAQAGRKDDALAEYREVFAVSAEDSWLEREVLARVGTIFGKEDDVVGLRQFYDQLRETYPRRVGVKKEAAKSLMATGSGDEGIAMFREVLKVLPGDRGVREEFVAMLESAGRLKEAAEEISALLATAENDAVLWEKLAAIDQSLKDDAGMNKAVDKAVALAAADEGGRVGAARIYERFGRKDEAEKTLREAVENFGAGGEAAEALTLFLVKDRPDDAVALWREMAKGADREGLLRISRSLSSNSRVDDAYALLKARAAEFGNDPVFLAALCQAAQLSDKAEEVVPMALELVRQAKTAGDLETAVRLAAGIISRAKEPDKWRDELAKKADATTQELCLLAELNEAGGDSIEAANVLKKATAGGDGLLAAAQRVRLYEMRGETTEAIAALREWIAMPGGLKAAQLKRLVELLDQAGETDAALKETENWKRIAPGDQQAWLKRVDIFLADGRPDDAVAELRRAIAKFGGDEEMKGRLAAAEVEAGLMDEAWRMYAGLYDEAESPASKLKWANALAGMATKEGREEELVNGFRKRARENPGSPLPSLALAEFYREWKEPEEERAAVAEASRRKPDDVGLLNRLADLEEAGGSAERAEELLRTVLRLSPTPEARRRLSGFRVRNGDGDAGLTEMMAAASKGGSAREGERLALTMVPQNKWEAVAKILGAEAAAHPDDWRVGYFYAVALREQGKTDEAFARFKNLLETDGDLASVTPLMQPGQLQWMKDDNGNFPAGLMFPMMREVALAYRKSPQARGYFLAGGNPLPLPGSALEARWMAAAQALSIAEEQPEKREQLLAGISSDKIGDLASVKRLSGLSEEEFRARLMSDEVTPEDFRWYLGRARFRAMSGRTGQDIELLRHCADVFAKTNPDAELMVLSSIPMTKEGFDPKRSKRLFDRIVALKGDRQERYQTTLWSLSFAEPEVVSEDIREQAEALTLAFMEKNKVKGLNSGMYGWLPVMWLRAGRFEPAVEWLNKIYEEPKKPQKVGPQRRNIRSYMGQINPGAQDPLDFSTVAMESVNETLAFEFIQQRMSGGTSSPSQEKLLAMLGEKNDAPAEQKRLDIATVVPVIPKLKDPVLRIFLYDLAGKTEDVKREIAEVEKADATDAKTQRLVAAYYHRSKEPLKAYAAMVKAMGLPAGDMADADLDGQLVTAGIAISAEKGIDLDPAKRAALRLRKSMGGSEETIAQLSGWMKALGMEEESARFVAGPKVAGKNRGSRNGFVNRGVQRVDPRVALSKLVTDGKKDLAARRILFELGRAKSSRNAVYEQDQYYRIVSSLNLGDELLAAAKPVDGASYERRADYAALLMRMKKNDLALPLLRQLSAERPDDIVVRSSLFIVLPEAEQAEALAGLADGKFEEEKLAEWLTEMSSRQRSNQAAELIKSLEVFVSFFEKLEPSGKADRNLTWVNYQALQIFQDRGNQQLRPVAERSPRSGKQNYDETLSTRWHAVARRYFVAMLRHPQTCEQGFLLLHGTRDSLKISAEDLDRYALAAIDTSARGMETDEQQSMYYGSSMSRLWSQRSANGSSMGGRELAMPALSPEDYILKRSAEGVVLDPCSESFFTTLEKSDPARAKLLRAAMIIATSEGSAAFDAWREKSKTERKTVELEWIVGFAKLKKRPDLLALSSDECAALFQKGMAENSATPREVSDTLLAAISGLPDLASRVAAIDRATRRLLGPPESWPLFAEIDPNQNYGSAIQQRLQIFQFLRSAFANSRLPVRVAMLRFLADSGLGSVGQNGSEIFARNMGDSNAETVAAEWLSSGLFAPGSAPAGPVDAEGTALLEAFCDSISDNAAPLGQVLLKTEGENRFWARLAGAKLAGATGETFKEIEGNVAIISAWPEAARSDFGLLVNRWFPNAAKEVNGPLRKLLTDALKNGDKEAVRQAEEYLKAGFDANFMAYSVSDKLGPLVQRLADGNPELSIRLWTKALDHFQKQPQNFNSSSYGFNRGMEAYAQTEILQGLSREKGSTEGFGGFLTEFFKQNPQRVGVTDLENLSGSINNLLENEAKSRAEEFGAEKSVVALKGPLKIAAGQAVVMTRDKDRRAVMAPLLMSLYSSDSDLDSSIRVGLLKWADEDFRKSEPELADWFALALATSLKPPVEAEALKKIRSRFVAFAANEKVPLDLRVYVVGRLFAEQKEKDLYNGSDCVKAAAGLFRNYLGKAKEWGSEEALAALVSLADSDALAKEDAMPLLVSLKAKPPAIVQSPPQEAQTTLNRVLFTLALKSGDGETLQRIVRQSNGDLGGRVDHVLKLWQAGQNESALALMARPGEFHKGSYWLFAQRDEADLPKPVFTKEIESGLPGWLASIADTGQRFRMECLISCAPDAAGDQAPAVARQARLAALVKRFPAEAPAQRASRMESLISLGNEALVIAPLAKDFRDAVRGQDLGTILGARENQNGNYSRERDDSYVMESLIRRAMRLSIEAGDGQYLLDQLKSLVTRQAGNSGYEVTRAIGNIGRWYGSLLALKIAELPAEQRAKPAAQALEIAAVLIGVEQSNAKSAAVSLAIISQAAAGSGVAFDQWLAALPAKPKADFTESRGAGMPKYLSNFKSPELAIPEYAERRRLLVTAILADAPTAAREIKHPMDISKMIDSGGFSLDDVTAAILALPEGTARRGEFLAERAGIIGWRTENREEALKGYDLAEAAAKDDEKGLTYVRCYKALFLMERTNQQAEARAIASSLNKDLLPAREKKQMEAYATPLPIK